MSLENCYKEYCVSNFVLRVSHNFEKTLYSGYFAEKKTVFEW